MTDRTGIPVFATVLVIAAIATMLALGVWQLGRAEWKADLLERYAAASGLPPTEFPTTEEAVEDALYRRAFVTCERIVSRNAEAGTSAEGVKGLAQIARCALAGGGEADIVLGYTASPQIADWPEGDAGGATVGGIIGPGRSGEARLIAQPPQAGLAPIAAPNPADLPNNHTAYAWQWFFFALTAGIIYVLAVRRRRRDARGA
ncbi:SURF1 family protein [Paraurantiacibacter namhicola]|uniref:SURF1-like protein n=1 Tax=Paraurantiacibacter namhicola TaxID=645517 RepID=A0A1C7D7F2_9SPHN|nr:SURF1 family protein [Paraurantiacibacter namhicola]ANU07416.1 SURF1 family protein [Paraurantiacibacter namhicola]